MLVMLPLLYFARKLDGEDPDVVYLLRCTYFTIHFFIVLTVFHVFLTAQKMAKAKYADLVIYVPPPPQPFQDDGGKTKYKEVTFGEHMAATAKQLLTSTLFGILVTSGLHFYKGMTLGICMQSVMGPLNLIENKLVRAILMGGAGSMKDDSDSPKSQRIFDEKYKDELTKDDVIVEADGTTVKKTRNISAAAGIAGKKAPSFEELLLDTWDEGDKADIDPLLKALNESNANFKTKDNAWTPLMIFSALGADKCDDGIQKLKDLGANAGIVDGEGWNALHWAAFHGSASGAAKILEVFGASAGLQDVKDKEGKTALEHAKAEGNTDVVKVIEVMTSAGEGSGLADKDGLRKRK